ncbi:transcriptional regulator family: Zinc finger, CCHC-type [Agaricus bisporus var. burnettii]|uniref:Transcriptional regulator family: Zinc finger, CCHC-type n=1 Tax=Agaricus bisporus var. burnettii TaxID=192524 RepID=A0A8H7C3F4_AGABI|nr:transcriptional regulator family: Zinc finger, CCHC-type [Agaricus bisporus var. burnettii]
MKLWSGLRPKLQKALITIEKLSAETADWNEVVNSAECHEIASKIEYKQSGADSSTNRKESKSQNDSGGRKTFNRDSVANTRTDKTHGDKDNKDRDKGAYRTSGPPKLTNKQRTEYRAQGKCFKCGEKGHLSRNCVKYGKSVKGGSKPPGLKSFNAEIDTEEMEILRDMITGTSEEVSETLEAASLFVGSMVMTREDDMNYDELLAQLRYCRVSALLCHVGEDEYEPHLKNPFADRLTASLEWGRPYPTDNALRDREIGSARFNSYRISTGKYVVDDEYDESFYVLDSDELSDHRFDPVRWLCEVLSKRHDWRPSRIKTFPVPRPMLPRDAWADALAWNLETGASRYALKNRRWWHLSPLRFEVYPTRYGRVIEVKDRAYNFGLTIPRIAIEQAGFNPRNWYTTKVKRFICDNIQEPDWWFTWTDLAVSLFYLFWNMDIKNYFDDVYFSCLIDLDYTDSRMFETFDVVPEAYSMDMGKWSYLRLCSQWVEPDTYSALQRTSSTAKDLSRLVPKPVVIQVRLNGKEARALVDTGSLSDFVSSLQMAVQGSRSKINYSVMGKFQYESIVEMRQFDVINLSGGTKPVSSKHWQFGSNEDCVRNGYQETDVRVRVGV